MGLRLGLGFRLRVGVQFLRRGWVEVDVCHVLKMPAKVFVVRRHYHVHA